MTKDKSVDIGEFIRELCDGNPEFERMIEEARVWVRGLKPEDYDIKDITHLFQPRTERTPFGGQGAERRSEDRTLAQCEDRTLALLKHRQKKHGDYEQCPVCFGFLSWEDHAECEEALSPSGAERQKGGRYAPTFMEYEMMEPEK